MARKKRRQPVAKPLVSKPRVEATVQEGSAPSFKQKLAGFLNAPKPMVKLSSKSNVSSSQVAEVTREVRAGVMNELRKHGTQTQPFQSVLLPLPRRRPAVPLWAMGSVVAIVVLVGLVWWAGSSTTGAELALNSAERAARDKNAALFERLVDIPALSSSVIEQVLPPQPENAGGAIIASPFEAGVRAHLQNLVAGSHAPNPALVASLSDQVLAAVASGRSPPDDTLLGQLWLQLGGGNLKVGHAKLVRATDDLAEAELPLSRDDLGFDVALKVILAKHNNQWQVVDIPNVAQALALVAEAEAETDVTEANANDIIPAAGPHNAPVGAVTADVLHAAKDAKNNLQIRLNVANFSGLPVSGVDVRVIVGDANGRPLKESLVHHKVKLAPTQSAEQVLTVTLDTRNRLEKFIADLPLTALTVRAQLVDVRQ